MPNGFVRILFTLSIIRGVTSCSRNRSTSRYTLCKMDDSRTLRIVQTCEFDASSFFRWNSFWICVNLLPILLVCMHTGHLHGEDTYRLQHDIETAMLQTVPAPSMWVDYQPLKSGSTYVPVGLIREGMFETFIMHIPLNIHITAMLQLSFHSLISFIILQMLAIKFSLKQYKKWRISMFLALVTLYSFLVSLALDGTLTFAYVSVKDNFLAWLESNIVELYLDDDVNEETTYHPFTLGQFPPYYYTTRFRYLREDVVLECEYNVTTDLDVDRAKVTTWWRKNGVPVHTNDRIYVNVSIENIDMDTPLLNEVSQQYLIRSRLTIEVIEERDYGLYTCDYINPLPGNVRVNIYNPENTYNRQTVQTPQPMTPHPKCNCQPTCNEKAKNLPISVSTVCFSEFFLRPFAETTKMVQIRPGGILVTAATYRTVTNMSDIKVDVTFEGNTDHKGNSECCSLFIKIYWALFRTGSFVDLPISRLIGQHSQNSTSQLAIIKYRCICVDSFGIHDYSFYRNHFNTTIKKEEEIEIKHPVSVFIQPRDNGSIPLIGGFSFCHRSDDWWLCRCVEVLLDNSLYIFYTYDVFILGGVIVIVVFMILVRLGSAVLIAKPLRKLCFRNFQYILPFTAVKGPPVFVDCSCENEVSATFRFDIYLSYSDDDEYDKEVSRYVKVLLTEAGVTVFDSVEGILPGHLVAHESAEAIQRSHCFVVIASKTYVNDNFKKMEFAAIQDAIVSRGSEPKDCLLIVQVEDCDIVGFHRVPCIHVPAGLKETFSLDQSSINRFYGWIRATRTVNLNEITLASQLSVSVFNVKSVLAVLFIIGLMYLAAKSPILQNATHFPNETDVACVD